MLVGRSGDPLLEITRQVQALQSSRLLILLKYLKITNTPTRLPEIKVDLEKSKLTAHFTKQSLSSDLDTLWHAPPSGILHWHHPI